MYERWEWLLLECYLSNQEWLKEVSHALSGHKKGWSPLLTIHRLQSIKAFGVTQEMNPWRMNRTVLYYSNTRGPEGDEAPLCGSRSDTDGLKNVQLNSRQDQVGIKEKECGWEVENSDGITWPHHLNGSTRNLAPTSYLWLYSQPSPAHSAAPSNSGFF